MASRKEQKEKARAERVAREEAERRQSSQRRRVQIGAAVGGVAIVAAVIVVIVLVSGGGDGDGGGGETSSSSGITYSKDSVPADVEAGLQDTDPPWKPDYKDLSGRIEAMGLPGFNETISHTHSWLHIYNEGKKVPVPANIGIDPATSTISPLHTHDTTGIIHMEADRDFDFTLGQLMAIWGVEFSKDQIGSLKASGENKLQVYLDGKVVSDPVNVVMPEKGNFVIGYGKPGTYPTDPKVEWPQGL
jgi:hypothetical protein